MLCVETLYKLTTFTFFLSVVWNNLTPVTASPMWHSVHFCTQLEPKYDLSCSFRILPDLKCLFFHHPLWHYDQEGLPSCTAAYSSPMDRIIVVMAFVSKQHQCSHGPCYSKITPVIDIRTLVCHQHALHMLFRLDALALSVIATATWLAGWVSVTAGIVSKRLNLSENFFDHLIGPS